MPVNINIQNELQELSAVVAAIPAVNVYQAPEGYFDGLAADLLFKVSEGSGAGNSNAGMQVPEGYFDGLAGTIMARIKMEEVTDSQVLPGYLQHTNVYEVPQGYFEQLPAAIMAKLQQGHQENEGDEFSAILSAAKGINVYQVPDGYFDGFASTVTKQITQPAKVVSMGKRPTVFRYAAAAVITGILGFSLFSIFKSSDTGISEERAAIVQQGKQIAIENRFDSELETITDDEIVQYLTNSGQDVNAALVASVTDEQMLPEQDEYMFDDKTLDKFLTDLNISGKNNSN